MAVVNRDFHKVVVVVEGEAYGFSNLSTAVLFIEEINKGADYSKVFDQVATALSDDKEDSLQVFDIDIYADLFLDEDDEDDEV